MRRRHAVLSLAACAAGLTGCDAPAPVALRRWPALPVRDLAGRPLTLASTSERARVINVWALWCPPCRRELPSLQRLAKDLAPRAIEVSTIALADDGFAVREYLDQSAVALPSVLLAPGAGQAAQIRLDALPQTFVIASDGAVLVRWSGAREWDLPQVRQALDGVLRSV